MSNLDPCSVVSSVYKCGTNGRWCGCIAECTWMAFHRSAQWGPGNWSCPFKLNSLISRWDFTPKHPQCCLSHDLHDTQLKLSSLLFFYLPRMRWGLGSLCSFKIPKASEYLVAAVYALDQSGSLVHSVLFVSHLVSGAADMECADIGTTELEWAKGPSTCPGCQWRWSAFCRHSGISVYSYCIL